MTGLQIKEPKPAQSELEIAKHPAHRIQRAILDRLLASKNPAPTGPVGDYVNDERIKMASPIMDVRLQHGRNILTVAVQKTYSKIGDGTHIALVVIYYRDNRHVFALERTSQHLLILFDELYLSHAMVAGIHGQKVSSILTIDDPVIAQILSPIMELNIIEALIGDDGLEVFIDPNE